MIYRYKESNTSAHLSLSVKRADWPEQVQQESELNLLSIVWNTGPKQTAWVDEVPFTLESGDCILLIYEHRFRFERNEDLVAWRFNRDFYCIIDHDEEVSCVGFIFYGMPSPMLLKLDEAHQHKFNLLSQVFIDEFGNHDNLQGEMMRMLLKRLIVILTRLAKVQHLKTKPHGDELDTIRQFNLLVEQHFATKHQVQDYAELLFKSPKTLSNLFGKYSDKTPLQVIRERMALEAKRLLRYSDKPISEIGYDLGFSESAHFSRFFKKMSGYSASKFRALGKMGN
ncbi:MAG: helix-turn-helix domain-containing protein [Bacteroidota bacterium]